MKLLKQLSETPGAPGREERVRALIQKEVAAFADEVREDNLGNLICVKKSKKKNAPKVMVACHMDEIAFYVRHIDDKGFIRLQPLGGFDPKNLHACRVLIQGKKEIVGNLNACGRPIHMATDEDRKKQHKVSDFVVDTGRPAAEIKKLVRPGDPVTLIQDFLPLGNLVSGKALDNRIACWVGARALQKLVKPSCDVYVAFTVQEEVGIRGAMTCAYAVEPDIGIAVDVTLAVDTPGISADEQVTKLGNGVAIKIMDSASISDRGLVDRMVALAEKHKIPHQMEIMPVGGTDARALQLAKAGAKVVTLSVPTRYIHTITETANPKDLEAAVDLLVRYLEE